MNFQLAFVLALATVAFAADDAAPPPAEAPKTVDSPVAGAAPKSTGCNIQVGSNIRNIGTGNEICWRPPEYLVCVGNDNWASKFCKESEKCRESGGKVSCGPNPDWPPPELPLETINPGAAGKIDKKKVLDRKRK